MRVIFLIMIGLNVLSAEITRDSNGIVTDTGTKLQWQDDTVGSAMAWEASINHCESLTLGGHSDWRLPNINELISIVDKLRVDDSVIVGGFVNTSSNGYWSSSSYEGNKDDAWIVSFSYGYTGGFNYRYDKDANNYVRCVRDGQ